MQIQDLGCSTSIFMYRSRKIFTSNRAERGSKYGEELWKDTPDFVYGKRQAQQFTRATLINLCLGYWS